MFLCALNNCRVNKKRKKDGKPEATINTVTLNARAKKNIESHVGEQKLYAQAAKDDGKFKGSLYRTDAGDAVFKTAQKLFAFKPSDEPLGNGGSSSPLESIEKQDNRPKEVTIIGIEPKMIDYGLELSQELEEKMPQLIELVLDEIKETNTSMEVKR